MPLILGHILIGLEFRIHIFVSLYIQDSNFCLKRYILIFATGNSPSNIFLLVTPQPTMIVVDFKFLVLV